MLHQRAAAMQPPRVTLEFEIQRLELGIEVLDHRQRDRDLLLRGGREG
jgi:hypothetical protein